jgi:hypothetical protein
VQPVPPRAAFFHQKLAVARRHLQEMRRILAALGQRLDKAKTGEEVDVEAEVAEIDNLIWSYHDALESAREAWLRNELSGRENDRLLTMPTPLSLGLPLFVDEGQAERAQRQQMEISRRLSGRDAMMDRVIFAMKVAEGAGTAAGILLGGGMVVAAYKQGGKWAVAKLLAKEAAGMAAGELAERAAVAAGVDAQVLHGVQLAAAVVRFILLRRGNPPPKPERSLGAVPGDQPGGTPKPSQEAQGASTPKGSSTPADAASERVDASQSHRATQPQPSSPRKGTGLVPKAPVKLGEWGETRLRQLFGGRGAKPKSPFKTKDGPRYVDWLVDGIAHESKAGLNVALTSKIRKQVLKDAELIANREIEGAHWHFWQGAQQELLDFLTSVGINYTVH